MRVETKRKLHQLLASTLAFSILAAPTLAFGAESTSDNTTVVQLLAINDFHGQLDTLKVLKDKNGNVTDTLGGADYLAAYLKDRASRNPNTLLVHAGDAVGASAPVSALLNDEPTIQFLNQVGFSVGTVGNHEFDKSAGEMMRLSGTDQSGKPIGLANFPYVCANIVDEKTNQPLLPPYVVKDVGGVKIGFIGVVTMETPSIVKPTGIAGLQFIPQAGAIKKAVDELKQKGVKSIVVLAHDPGVGTTEANASGEAIDLAKAVDPEVDLIIAGHNHGKLNVDITNGVDPSKKIKVVEAYSYGIAFDDLNLHINRSTHDVVSIDAEIVDVSHKNMPPDASITNLVKKYQEQNATVLNAAIGKTDAPILAQTSAVGESALGNLIADGMRETMNTDFAFMNSGGIRNDMPQGNVTYGDLFKIQPFGNALIKMSLTGSQIKTFLNQQWGGTKTRMAQISGFEYTYDESKPIGQKIISLTKADGTPIEDNQSYTVVVNDFMAAGGDGYEILKNGTDRTAGPVDLDATVAYLRSKFQNGTIKAAIQGRVKGRPFDLMN